jgi:O-6-methylguanine DNA methyltransferase
MSRVICRAETPLGVLSALYDDGVITRVLFPDEMLPAGASAFDDTLPFAVQMREYLHGDRREFSLPILIPGTPFRQSVYRAVIAIPYATTATYGDIAAMAGHPRAMRAVGTTMRLTPLPVLIPCHRVVHKNHAKSAYRGGLDMKHFLLDMESRYAAKMRSSF